MDPSGKDSLTEQRNSRKNKHSKDSRKSLKDENRRVSDQVRLPNKLSENLTDVEGKAPINRNSEGYKRKLIKKKNKPNSIHYMNKNGNKISSGKHTRTSSKSNMLLGSELALNNQSTKSSGRLKKPSK